MARRNKLSPTQQRVLDDLKRQVDQARSYTTYEDYFLATEAPRCNCLFDTPEKYKARAPRDWERNKKSWERLLEGEGLTHCSGPTIYKLEKLGYITIVEDTTSTTLSYDIVKLVNY